MGITTRMTIIMMTTIMRMGIDTIITAEPGLQATTRLMTWLSPAFPVGGFSYSHGIEYAVEAGLVSDRATLGIWIEGILRFGAGRNDGMLLLAAHRAANAMDVAGLLAVAQQAMALRGTAELALEAGAQGQAFLKAVRHGWPEIAASAPVAALARDGLIVAYPIAIGVLTAAAGLAEAIVLESYLTAFAGNLVSAGIRLVPLGQSDGIAVQAALEPLIARQVLRLREEVLANLGSAALAVDWTSMKHETQYTRLFRS
jgi:urease accessory protein